MTPQECTELNEALELAGNVADEAWQMGLNVHAAKKLASALLSLAAESEELRAENERRTNERDFYREMSNLRHDERNEARRNLKALESRYSALVTALKQIAALEDGYVEDSKEAAQILTIIGNIVQDALAAALTPKEGE